MAGKSNAALKQKKTKNALKQKKQNTTLWRKSKKLLLWDLIYPYLACVGRLVGRHLILPHHHLCHLIIVKENLSKYP
jgi:hypothetical protein